MIRDYLTAFARLPMILARLESELQGKASTVSVTAITGRLANRPTNGDLTVAKSELGGRIDGHDVALGLINDRLELLESGKMIPQVLPAEPTDITHPVQKVRAPRKPKGSQ